jgi:hypothetical protein
MSGLQISIYISNDKCEVCGFQVKENRAYVRLDKKAIKSDKMNTAKAGLTCSNANFTTGIVT